MSTISPSTQGIRSELTSSLHPLDPVVEIKTSKEFPNLYHLIDAKEASNYPVMFSKKSSEKSQSQRQSLETLPMVPRLQKSKVSSINESYQVELFISSEHSETLKNVLHHIQIFKFPEEYDISIDDGFGKTCDFNQLSNYLVKLYDKMEELFPGEKNFRLEYAFLVLDSCMVEEFFSDFCPPKSNL